MTETQNLLPVKKWQINSFRADEIKTFWDKNIFPIEVADHDL